MQGTGDYQGVFCSLLPDLTYLLIDAARDPLIICHLLYAISLIIP
jgi:hypothetical protein